MKFFAVLGLAAVAAAVAPHVTGRNPSLKMHDHHPRDVVATQEFVGTLADLDCNAATNDIHFQSPFEGGLIEAGYASVGELYHGNGLTACSKGLAVFDLRDLEEEPCFLTFHVGKAGGLFKENPLSFQKEQICISTYTPSCPSSTDTCTVDPNTDYDRTDVTPFARFDTDCLAEGDVLNFEATSLYSSLVGQGCLGFRLEVCPDVCDIDENGQCISSTTGTCPDGGSGSSMCSTSGRAWTFTDFTLDDEQVGGGGQDPHFVGFNGQRYDVMGENGKIYNILSDADIQMNAKVAAGCKEYRSVFTEVAIKYLNHKITFMENGVAKLEGYHIEAGRKWALSSDGEEYMIATNPEGKTGAKLEIVTKDYKINLTTGTQRHCTANRIDFSVTRTNLSGSPHGLLGVTARKADKARRAFGTHLNGIIEGDIEDYVVRDDDMFGNDFEYNKFHHKMAQMKRAGRPHAVEHETREAPSQYDYAHVAHPHVHLTRERGVNKHVEA